MLLAAGEATALGGRDDRGRRRARTTRRTLIFALAWWVVAALLGAWLGRRPRRPPRHRAACSRRRQLDHDAAARSGPAPVLLNRLWLLVAVGGARGRHLRGCSRSSPRSRPAARSWSRSPGASRSAAVTAIEERDGVRYYVVPTLALPGDRARADARACRRVCGRRRTAPARRAAGPARGASAQLLAAASRCACSRPARVVSQARRAVATP